MSAPEVPMQARRQVDAMVSHMVNQKAEGGHPLTPQQVNMLTNHLLSLWSAPTPPSQQEIVQVAGAMLRSFSQQQGAPSQPPPSAAPAPAQAAPAQPPAQPAPAQPAAPPAAAAPRPATNANLSVQAQLIAMAQQNPQMAAAMAAALKGVRPGMANPAALAAAAAGIRALGPRPQGPAPRVGFTPDQKATLHAQIMVFKKIKNLQPGQEIPKLTQDELAAIRPKPLPPGIAKVMSGLNLSATAAAAAAAAAKPGGLPARPAGPPATGAKPGAKPGVPPPKGPPGVGGKPSGPTVTTAAAAAAAVAGAPKGITNMMREIEPQTWKGPPPQEWRGTEVPIRFEGPLLGLGDPLVAVPPASDTLAHAQLAAFKAAGVGIPGLMGPQWEVAKLMERELEGILAKKRKRRLEELYSMLGSSPPVPKSGPGAKKQAVETAAGTPKALAAPAAAAVAAAAGGAAAAGTPSTVKTEGAPAPQANGTAEQKAEGAVKPEPAADGAAPGPAAAAPSTGASTAASGAVAVKAEGGQAAPKAAEAPGSSTAVALGSTAAAVSAPAGAGRQAAPPGVDMVPGFVCALDGRPARGALMLELRKLRLAELQTRLRREINEEHIRELAVQREKDYKRLMREGIKWRVDDLKQRDYHRYSIAIERAEQAKQLKSAMMERQALLKDIRVARNKGCVRAHERLGRDLAKKQEDDRDRRLNALRANDFEAYQELLRQQQGDSGNTEEDRFHAISKFLNETEEYLNKLAARVAMVKVAQEAEEYVRNAMEEARRAGGSEDEIRAAGERAALEFRQESELLRRSKNMAVDAQTRYYELAHSVQEEVTTQPVHLRPPQGATLREYQMVGLKWMVSLYNNHLNGILADEMGLGKTVQVMALIAYLMEHKNNFGPHLIIVPNAVIVNWKSELQQWLPTVKCVYYVGGKDERARKYTQEVASMQFNVLVTTYEYIMRDRAKLSKVDWRYIIIDEAQRLKERQSKLAKDLDRFQSGRRLLLTGTPLQNELRELWSLLNLLLPEVFDDKKQFTDWFDSMLEEEGGGDDDDEGLGGRQSEARLLANEKKLVVVHRLHQILVPFMLRRQVQDVEGKLPPKVPVVVKTPMTPYQAAIYNWVKLTGTIKLYPTDPLRLKMRRDFCPLNNKAMELRKVCNHPLLSFPEDLSSGAELLRQCGKMVVLDRILVKFFHTGHRVLLFCTMTKLLDLLEHYLRWRELPGGRRMHYRRIDGSTPLEAREAAIRDFNAPSSDVFIFLLSIRAAGRGLNLQTSDTVVIYDPDPNPKNEEQAIARSHRIGQKKEVRVIHLETVVDPVDASRGTREAGMAMRQVMEAAEAEGGEPPRFFDSVESMVRNLIQKQKIDMASEVIDAGRFDMTTTMDERRATLEALLQDEDRNTVPMNEVLDWHELNKKIARGDKELELFDRLDLELDWPGEPPPPDDPNAVPEWAAFSGQDVRQAQATSQKKPSATGILAMADGTAKKKGRGRGRGVPPGRGAGPAPAAPGRGGRGAPVKRGGRAPARGSGSAARGGRPAASVSTGYDDDDGPSVSGLTHSMGPTTVTGGDDDDDDEAEAALLEEEEAAMEEEEHLTDRNIVLDEDGVIVE